MARNISPSKRFQVLQRDNFTCRYCQSQRTGVELHVDHVIPVARGGTDDFDNLVTACVQCNQGKSDSLLGAQVDMERSPITLAVSFDEIELSLSTIEGHTFFRYDAEARKGTRWHEQHFEVGPGLLCVSGMVEVVNTLTRDWMRERFPDLQSEFDHITRMDWLMCRAIYESRHDEAEIIGFTVLRQLQEFWDRVGKALGRESSTVLGGEDEVTA